MAYELRFTRDAQKSLAAMPKADAQRIVSKLEEVALDPLHARNIKKLVERQGYRLRAGDWRALFTLNHDQLIVTVIKIDNRREVYRR